MRNGLLFFNDCMARELFPNEQPKSCLQKCQVETMLRNIRCATTSDIFHNK